MAIGKHNLAQFIAHLIAFFLNGMKLRGNLTIFRPRVWEESGNANLPIGGLQNAIQENGVPGIAVKQC
jgi:hypothetical protein